MDKLLKSVRSALVEKNYYSALFVTLALPDICAASEHGKTLPACYSAWWEKYMPSYRNFLGGNDCYALRCAMLHQGKDDITDQAKKDALDYYVFLTQGPNCNLISNCEIGGKLHSFLQLNVADFCEDVCMAVEKWIDDTSATPAIVARLNETIEIHSPGYIHLDVVEFG